MTSYIQSGVDINAGNKLVTDISEKVRATFTEGCLATFGGFGAGFELPTGFQKPVIISGTDGVGTKLRVAIKANKFDTIGQDLVAMCYNDVICSGAKPLYFLDYYASSKLRIDIAEEIIESIANACLMANVGLIGGETAELPCVFQENEFDIAGFCSGIVEKEEIIDGFTIMVGDPLIAIPSSGVHANGFSLINHIIDDSPVLPNNLFDELLTPTRIYTEVLDLINDFDVPILGITHITGGGIVENLPRIKLDHRDIKFVLEPWEWPRIFRWIQQTGNVSTEEMLNVFNCGVGMILCVPQCHVDGVLDKLPGSWVIGAVAKRRNNVERAVAFNNCM